MKAKPKITWHPCHPLDHPAEGRWKCVAPGTHAGWGNTPNEAYGNWMKWKALIEATALGKRVSPASGDWR